MLACRSQPAHPFERIDHVRLLWSWRGFRLEWHTGFQEFAHSRCLAASGRFFQYHLRFESLKVEFLVSQCGHQPVRSPDPPIGSRKRVNLLLQIAYDRRHSHPLAYVVFHFFFVAVDCNGEAIKGVVSHPGSILWVHGIKVGSDKLLGEIANIIGIYAVLMFSSSDYEAGTFEIDSLSAHCYFVSRATPKAARPLQRNRHF